MILEDTRVFISIWTVYVFLFVRLCIDWTLGMANPLRLYDSVHQYTETVSVISDTSGVGLYKMDMIFKHFLADGFSVAVTVFRGMVFKPRRQDEDDISLIPPHTPYPFSLHHQVLTTPQELYQAILNGTEQARSRITMTSLYLGTGKLEDALVSFFSAGLASGFFFVQILPSHTVQLPI